MWKSPTTKHHQLRHLRNDSRRRTGVSLRKKSPKFGLRRRRAVRVSPQCRPSLALEGRARLQATSKLKEDGLLHTAWREKKTTHKKANAKVTLSHAGHLEPDDY